jgi:hypothetical protein
LIVKVHLSGVAICYEPKKSFHTHDIQPINAIGRYQGSLYNQQKRAISDAVEWIRLHATHKPLFFVLTSPGYVNAKEHSKKISQFTHTLRNGYGCKHYVWVRELTSRGFPHYHFVADLPFIRNPVALSRYWSSLFGSTSTNSLRLGSAPINGKRKFYVDDQRASRYIAKYIGKDLEKIQYDLLEAGYPQARYSKMYRSFAISEQARMMSQPVEYEANYRFSEREAWNHSEQRVVLREFVERTFQDDSGQYVDPNQWDWKRIEPHNVFIGFQRSKS